MGLDMYLRATKYISSYTEPETLRAIAKVVEADKIMNEDTLGASVDITIGYWRKANAIHDWFMQLTDEDNCQPVYLERQRLVELLNTCSEVSAAKDDNLSAQLLPTASGFFFGSTEYDEYYYGQVDETIKLIKRVLDNTDDSWSFEYQASW